MKYVYTDSKINRGIPENVPVRLILGTVLGFVSVFFVIGACSNLGDPLSMLLLLLIAAACGAIAFLVVFFAIRTIIAIRSTRARTPADVIASDEKRPFYSSQCPNCQVLIDYQRSDLAYRLWLRKGYVECPCCQKPIRHDEEKNCFIPHRYPEQ